ncbi:hypothetical protein [uncultured Arthrobacter sp.]|uniref:hypothetical protein n=1 Tax=uncultured Arthrobacter sp. TaxID=114050 RepID=UPI00321674E9
MAAVHVLDRQLGELFGRDVVEAGDVDRHEGAADLLDVAVAERGIAPDAVSLRFSVLGAEPGTERMREEVDAGLGVRCPNIFGLSEVIAFCPTLLAPFVSLLAGILLIVVGLNGTVVSWLL